MQSTSPRINAEPLLRDEMPTGPRLGAYAPPPSQTSRGDSFDLQLTATDSVGQMIPIEEEYGDGGDEGLPSLPPLISYCSYVRFGCAFGKWILLVVIVNVIAFAVCIKAGYFGYERLWPVNSWQGWFLATVWFLTSVWFYLSAKVVEKDVQMMDRQYEPGRLSEDDGVTPQSFVPNYENIYGQVSRKIDTSFHSPNEPTSSLVNLSLALWAVSLAATVFLGTGLAWGKHYQASCDHKNLPNSTSSSNKGDFSKIQSYPDDVQTWIVEQTDPWGSRYRIEPSNDDYNTDDGGNNNNNNRGGDGSYSFPTAYSMDYGIFATMEDGTVFFAGQPLDENYEQSKYLVLVESPGTGGPPKYHTDIRNPRMFIPVAKTASKNDNGNWVASQYCFTASKDPAERKKSRRSWDSIIRTTPIHCIKTKAADDSGKGGFDIAKTKLVWTDKIQPGAQVSAASTDNEILVTHTGTSDGSSVFQEAVSINPNTMESKFVYHLTTTQSGYYSWYDGPKGSETIRCIQNHVQGGSAIASMVVMVLSGIWLIFREGVPVGVTPILLAVVCLIRLFSGEWQSGLAQMSLTLGTLFFLGVLACGNICPLPAWMGRDMHVWALYSWILSFIILDLGFHMGGVGYMAMTWLGLSGIILNHPVPQIMGYFYVGMGIWYFIMFPFFGYYFGDYLLRGALYILVGIGIIGLSTCLSNNRRYCVAVCRPVSRAGRTMFYGAPPPPSSSRTPRTGGATTTTTTTSVV